MKKTALLLMFAVATATAQTTVTRLPAIEKMVGEISTDSLHSYITHLTSFASRHSHSSHDAKDNEIGAAQEWLKDKFSSLNSDLKVSIDSYTLPPTARVKTEQVYRNVVARLEGSDPTDKRLFIMSGHLDSRAADGNDAKIYSPGANDDASSIAAMLELSRVLKGQKFPATIIFAAFSGEEVGLRGAGAMADKAHAEGWNIGALLNNDMIGQSTSNGTNLRDNTKIRVFSQGVPAAETDEERRKRVLNSAENDGVQRQLARYIAYVGEQYVDNLEVVMIYRNDRFGRGGDHTPFVNYGYPAVRITEINENFDRQHKDISDATRAVSGDVPEAMDFEYLRKNAAMNLAVLSSLASAPSEPQNARINLSIPDNRSHISWQAPAFGKATAYYVVMRDTTSPKWQKMYYTTENSIVLPYSRDNYIFGVQSVGTDGSMSVATTVTAP